MKIGIVAGEPSGDLLGADLINSLREKIPALQVTGVGGPAMIAAGCDSLFNMEDLSVMGLIEPLLHLKKLFKIRSKLIDYFSANKPDVFIGIDYPDFNLSLENKLRQKNIPIIHYVSPSVWAWRQKRIFKIAKIVDHMLTLFPFEADFYRKHQVPVTFVGHPLADSIPLEIDRLAARKALNLSPDAIYIAILPGSRKNEIKYLADVFIQTARYCWHKKPDLFFITAAINEKRNQEFQAHCKNISPDLPIKFFVGKAHQVMAAANVVLVASGTATLETMLYKRPMVVSAKMANLTYQIAKYLVKVKKIALPNLLANQSLVPEFIQQDARPEVMGDALLDFLNHPEKISALEQKFLALHSTLRQNASEKAAMVVLSLVE